MHGLKSATIASALMIAAWGSASAADEDHISFKMVVSKGASTCLPNAGAKVQIISDGQAEDMFIVAGGLPPDTGFGLLRDSRVNAVLREITNMSAIRDRLVHQIDDKVENLGFERNGLSLAAQFASLDIEHVIAKPENHPCSPYAARAPVS